MKQDVAGLPRSPLGWALGFSAAVMLFASVHVGEKPASLNITTASPKITTVAARPVAHSSSRFASEKVCQEALPAETMAHLGDRPVSLYHCVRLAENASIEMVGTATMPLFR